MQRVKQTLLGFSTLSARQTCILIIICCIFVLWIPSNGFINIISQAQNVDYLSSTFVPYCIAYTFGCIINAILIDIIGPRWSLLFCGILLSISICFFALLSTNDDSQINYLILSLNALASSGIFPSMAKFIYIYFYPAQYDVVFIIIALSAHICSLSTTIGIDTLMQSSLDTLLHISYMAIFGIALLLILSMFLRQDKDEKWFLSPLTVYDASNNKYDDDFCERQITLKLNERERESEALHLKDIEQTDSNSNKSEDIAEFTLQNRTLKAEINQYIQQKPKYLIDTSLLMMYALVLCSMCFLCLMNCLNVFSLNILQELLPGFKYDYDEYPFSSVNTISSMLQFGMIISLFIALFYRCTSNDAVYGHYKCSSVLVKLLMVISLILCIMVWSIEYSKVHPGTSTVCLVLFHILFVVFGVCIAYPIHVFCFVFLLSISGYNSGFVFSILELFMFLVSVLYAVVGNNMGSSIGWQWLSLLFVFISIVTVHFYTKLNDIQCIMNLQQTRQFFVSNKKMLKPKDQNYSEISSSSTDVECTSDPDINLDSDDY